MNTLFGQSASLDIDRVERLLEEELNAFIRDLPVHPIPQEQDRRAFFIIWFAVFLPEVVPTEFTKRLLEVAIALRQRTDFRTWGWYRSTHLDVALFALTGDTTWLQICKRNYSHQSKALRTQVLEALAFVVDKLEFEDETLLEQAEHNLNCCHFHCEWSAALILVASGEAVTKRAWLTNWLSEGKFLNARERETLQELAEGNYVPNSFFLNLFLDTQQYVLVRLACTLPPRYVQGTLLELPPQQTTLNLPDEPDFAGLLWKRLRRHPLVHSHIRISD